MIVMTYNESLKLKEKLQRNLEKKKKTMTREEAVNGLIRSGIFTHEGKLAPKFQPE